MAINIVASGLTATLALTLFHEGGQTPALPATARFAPPPRRPIRSDPPAKATSRWPP